MYGFRAKLATMGAGKTEDLIREYYTHKRKVDRTGATILTLKPSKDTRNSGINSRNGLSLTADIVVLPNQDVKYLLEQIEFHKELIILVDEVQSLEVNQVDQLFNFYLEQIKQNNKVKISKNPDSIKRIKRDGSFWPLCVNFLSLWNRLLELESIRTVPIDLDLLI